MTHAVEFTQLLHTAEQREVEGQACWHYQLSDNWSQGRAIYGGLSTAFCHDAIRRDLANLPPLRSITVNFIGPGSDVVFVKYSVLRQGKSVTYIEAELRSEDGLICHTVFCFGAARESAIHLRYADDRYTNASAVTSAADYPPFFPQREECASDEQYRAILQTVPNFAHNFEVRHVAGSRPFSHATQPDLQLWVKHKDKAARDLTALIGLADMPPPAIVPAFNRPAPISSMSWMINLLTDDISNESGWWLLGSFAEHAMHGYSSQNMSLHNDRGELVLVGRQNVAIFY